ncbi:MAG: efflux transporter outer membrane subunit [Steroidobacteraceae bacterium]|jgi:multidrug efflux system outer membrane protein
MRLALAVGLSVLLAACAGLPPKPKPVDLPAEAPLAGVDLAVGGAWPAADWWSRYQDSTLDKLIDLALASSPTLATAHARFDSARESVRVAGAAAGARVDANSDFTRQRLSDNGLFPPELLGFHWYNLMDLGLQASYTFDWWGKQRAIVAAAVDEAHAARADRSAAALLLASSIADSYFGWQADQGRLALAKERMAAVQREGSIALERVQAELDSADTLHATAAAAAAVSEQIAGLEGSAQLRRVAVAALVGRSVAELPAFEVKPLPAVGADLPKDARLDLLSRRPDIAASRWRVESAQKNLDAARAQFYPDVSVNVLAGLQSMDIQRLIEYDSRVPLIGAAVHLPLFDSGRLKARYGANQALVDSAVAGYRETVVNAARDVATEALTRTQLAAQRAQRLIQVDAARQHRASAAARVRQGVIDARVELQATESWIDQRDALMQLDAAAMSADIGLQRALGGGYGSPPELANSNLTPTKATP